MAASAFDAVGRRTAEGTRPITAPPTEGPMQVVRSMGLLSFLAAAVVAQQQGGTVRGVVSDHSGAVIPRASVQVSGPAGEKSAVAQGDGSYSLPDLAAGQYILRVRFPGFVPFEKTILVEGGKTAQVPIQLVVGAEKQTVAVRIDPGPAVSVEPDQNATAIVVKGSDLDA